MTNDWILDVLADLQRFAEMNDMPGLARHLDRTALVAAHEVGGASAGPVLRGRKQDDRAGRTIPREVATGQDA